MQPLPVAPPGSSAHEFGYAFDMIVSPMEALSDVGATWESWGGKWGGEFHDPVHFEYPGFSAQDVGEPAVGSGLFARAVAALNALPWYVSMFLPVELTVTPTNQNMEAWAADVFSWIRSQGY